MSRNDSDPARAGIGRESDATGPFRMDARAQVYLWISGVFVTSLVLANIIGVKLFHFDIVVGPWTIPVKHTMGMLPFPLTFLLTDLVNEYYGRRAARRLTYVAFAMAFLAFVLIWISRQVPLMEGIPGTASQEAYENIFGSASVMYIASIVAFLCGTLLDIRVFGFFKRLTGGRYVWFRATGSTVIAQVFDSFIVTFLFFMAFPLLMGKEAATFGQVVEIARTGYILKFVIAVALTPVIYAGRWFIRRQFGMVPVPVEADR
jgi:queuosine precursor transporter